MPSKRQIRKWMKEVDEERSCNNSEDYHMEKKRKKIASNLNRIENVLEVASGMRLMKKIFG